MFKVLLDRLNITTEAINKDTFLNRFTVFKTSHLNRIIGINQIKFPYKSIFHIYTNLGNETQFGLPDFPFLKGKSEKPYYVNYVNLDDTYLKKLNSDKIIPNILYKYYLSQIQSDLIKTKSKLRLDYNVKNSYKDFPLSRLKFGIINYNPLSIITPQNADNSLTKYKLIYSNIFKTINNTSIANNVLLVPINNKFNKTQFQELLIPTFNINRLRSIDCDIDFIFLLELFSYILSIRFEKYDNTFNLLTNQSKSNLYIFFVNAYTNSGIIIPLKLFKKMVNNNKQYIYSLLESLKVLVGNQTPTINNKKQTIKIVKAVKTNITENIETPKIETELDLKQINEPKVNDIYKKEEIIDIVKDIDENQRFIPVLEQDIKKSKNKTVMNFISENLNNSLDESNVSAKQKEYAKDLLNQTIEKQIQISLGPNSKQIVKIKDLINQKSNIPIKPNVIPKHQDQLLDKSLAKSTVFDIDSKYKDKIFYSDMITSLISLSKNGLILTDYKEENEFNNFNRIKHVRVKFQDASHKSHTINFKIPVPNDDDIILIGGIKYYMRKQIVNISICKISPTRVSLVSSFNKTLVERKSHLRSTFSKSINKVLLELAKNDSSYEIDRGTKLYRKIRLPLEYTSLAKLYNSVKNSKYSIYFDQDNIFDYFKINTNIQKQINKYKSKTNTTFIGMNSNHNSYLFMNNKSNRVIEIKDFKQASISTRFLNDYLLLDNVSSYNTPKEYCYLKILDKALPIIFILGYKFGLFSILKELNIKYRLVTKSNPLNLQPNEMPIKFKDCTLIINRYPLLHSLIVGGLVYFNLSKYNFGDLDDPETYYNILTDKSISINYIKGIDNFYNFFIDPVTFDILKQIGEPTTPKGLLIRAVDMLTDEYFIETSSASNFRIKSLEKMSNILYNEITRQYAQYINDKKRDTTFSINTESVFLRILQDNSVVLYDETNPIHELKLRSLLTHLGFGGRTEEAFVETDRKYPEDGTGIMSEASPDSGKVGLNFSMPINATLKNVRGLLDLKDISELEPSSLLSVTGLAMPYTINDDPKRANFLSVQMSHVVPLVSEGGTGRVRTGFEAMIPYLRHHYCIVAEDNGIILNISNRLNALKIKYNNGRIKTYTFGSKIGNASGTYLKHEMVLADKLKKNQKIKKYDILGYNPGFFIYDPYMKQLQWKRGVYANVAFVETDTTIEDASEISSDFANKLKFTPVYLRQIELTPDSVIKDYKFIGDQVKYDTPLIETSFQDIETIKNTDQNDSELGSILQDLRSSKSKSNHSGKISNIEVFYTCPKEQMDISVQNFINKIEALYKAKHNLAKGSVNEDEFIAPGKLESGTRIKKKILTENSILIKYYVESEQSFNSGDKLVVGSQLKSVTAKVNPYPILTDDGTKISLLFGSRSLFDRIVLSAIKSGILERILEKIELDIVKMI